MLTSCTDKRYEQAPREVGGSEGSTVPTGIDERSERALREVGHTVQARSPLGHSYFYLFYRSLILGNKGI